MQLLEGTILDDTIIYHNIILDSNIGFTEDEIFATKDFIFTVNRNDLVILDENSILGFRKIEFQKTYLSHDIDFEENIVYLLVKNNDAEKFLYDVLAVNLITSEAKVIYQNITSSYYSKMRYYKNYFVIDNRIIVYPDQSIEIINSSSIHLFTSNYIYKIYSFTLYRKKADKSSSFEEYFGLGTEKFLQGDNFYLFKGSNDYLINIDNEEIKFTYETPLISSNSYAMRTENRIAIVNADKRVHILNYDNLTHGISVKSSKYYVPELNGPVYLNENLVYGHYNDYDKKKSNFLKYNFLNDSLTYKTLDDISSFLNYDRKHIYYNLISKDEIVVLDQNSLEVKHRFAIPDLYKRKQNNFLRPAFNYDFTSKQFLMTYYKQVEQTILLYDKESNIIHEVATCQSSLSDYFSSIYVKRDSNYYFNFAIDEFGSQFYKLPISPISSKVSNLLNSDLGILAYPNPSNGTFNIPLNEYKELKLFRMDGNLISSHKYEISKHYDKISINMNSVPNGIYLVNIVLNSGDKINCRIVKQN